MSTPSWLNPTPRAVAEVVIAAKDVESPVVTTAPAQMNNTFTAEEKAALSKVHWVLRILYMSVAILLSACAAYAITLSNVQTSISTTTSSSSTESWGVVFIALYVFMFSILVCCFEVGLTVVTRCMSENFGFLYTIVGRYFFMAMLAGLCVKLYLFGYFMIAFIAIAMLVHSILLFRNPRLGEYIRELHYYAGK